MAQHKMECQIATKKLSDRYHQPHELITHTPKGQSSLRLSRKEDTVEDANGSVVVSDGGKG